MIKTFSIMFLLTIFDLLAITIPGSVYHIPLKVNHSEVSGEMNHFLYQIDLSDTMANNSAFKKRIKNTSNISVYDSTARDKCVKYVHIDTANNYLIVSWDAPTSTSYDKIFYVFVDRYDNEFNNEETYTNSSYTYEWPFKEYSPCDTSREIIEEADLNVVSAATLGNDGIFGQCANNTGSGGGNLHMEKSNIVLPEDVSRSIELLININGYGNNELGRIIAAYPFYLYLWSGAGEQLRVTNDNFSNIVNFPISFGSWHHVLLVREYRGYVWVYIDGVSSFIGATGPSENSQNFYTLGEWGDYAFDGSLSDLGIMYEEINSVNYPLTRSNELISPETFWTVGVGVLTDIRDLMPIF